LEFGRGKLAYPGRQLCLNELSIVIRLSYRGGSRGRKWGVLFALQRWKHFNVASEEIVARLTRIEDEVTAGAYAFVTGKLHLFGHLLREAAEQAVVAIRQPQRNFTGSRGVGPEGFDLADDEDETERQLRRYTERHPFVQATDGNIHNPAATSSLRRFRSWHTAAITLGKSCHFDRHAVNLLLVTLPVLSS
jgi:hypothetical protein